MTPEQQHLLSRLEAFLSEESGETTKILDAKPLAGGASRETWYLKAQMGERVRDLVMRKDLPTQMFEASLTREQEFHLMDAAHQSGVRVAKVHYLCTDSSVLDGDFFIMDYMPGISIGRRVIKLPELADAREKLPEQMAEQLALIHKMDVAEHDLNFLPRPTGDYSPAQSVIQQVYKILDDLQILNPVWEWTLRRAERHQPTADHLTFIHGDFRLGNLLITEEGLSAVIDWEFGHVGDPDEELGYPCMRDWRFGNGHLRFAGLSDRETFLQHYETFSGRSVSREAVTWWEIMGNIRWGVICMSQANRHLSGEEQSVELASLGRRSAEMQLETLRLIEQRGF